MIFAMELNFEDRWQSDHSLTKTASPKPLIYGKNNAAVVAISDSTQKRLVYNKHDVPDGIEQDLLHPLNP